MPKKSHAPATRPARFADTPNRALTAAGAQFIYRELGAHHGGLPLVALTHLGANLDSWDPEVVDALARARRVLLLGYRGVGTSTGKVPDRFEDMGADVIAAIGALGFSRVDLLGLSMGGMVAQEVLRQAPDLVDRVILASTGPQGGPGLTRMTGVTVRTILRSIVTFANPTSLLFFTGTPAGRRAAKSYQARLRERRTGRDAAVSPSVFRAQLRAVKRWGREHPTAPTDTGPVLILHGDSDRMVPASNTNALLAVFPRATVQIFGDSGHGVVPQNREVVTARIDQFLRR